MFQGTVYLGRRLARSTINVCPSLVAGCGKVWPALPSTISLRRDDIVHLSKAGSTQPAYSRALTSPASPRRNPRNYKRKRTRGPYSNIRLNQELVRLGKSKDWKGILSLYQRHLLDFDGINYATALSRLATMPQAYRLCRTDGAFRVFVDDLMWCLQEKNDLSQWMRVREVANVAHSLGKLRFEANSVKVLVDFLNREETIECVCSQAADNPQAISNIVWSLARLGQRQVALRWSTAIEQYADQIIQNGRPQEVTNIAWAFATLQIPLPNFIAELDRTSLSEFLDKSKIQGISNLAWACAKMGLVYPKLFDEIDRRSSWLVAEGKPQELSNTAWSFATLGRPAPNLLAAIDEQATWLVSTGTSQTASNLAWAAATLATPTPNIFAEIEKQSSWLIKRATLQELGNMAWACATLRTSSPLLFQAIDKYSSTFFPLEKDEDSQAIANMAWAFATLHISPRRFFDMVDKHMVLSNVTPQSLSNIAWACASLDMDAPMFFEKIEARAKHLAQYGSPQSIANTALASAKLRMHMPQLFSNVDDLFASQRVHTSEWTFQDVTNILKAFAKNGQQPKHFLSFLKQRLPHLLREGDQQGCINICHAIAILDLQDDFEETFKELWSISTRDGEPFERESITQLLQAYAFSKTKDNGVFLERHQLSIASLPDIGSYGVLKSEKQAELSSLLNDLGIEYEEEVSPFEDFDDDIFFGDLLKMDIVLRSHRIAIEFDGPSHFLKQVGSGEVLSTKEDGPTKAKRRFLERLGWKVVNIFYLDWQEADTIDKKRLLVSRKLEKLTDN